MTISKGTKSPGLNTMVELLPSGSASLPFRTKIKIYSSRKKWLEGATGLVYPASGVSPSARVYVLRTNCKVPRRFIKQWTRLSASDVWDVLHIPLDENDALNDPAASGDIL